jgi:hypothetical protein
MNITFYSMAYLVFSTTWLTTLAGEDVLTRIIDGLGRPLAGVVAEIKWSELRADLTTGRQLKLVTLRSDENGMVHGSFEHPAFPRELFITIEFNKEGYREIIPSLQFSPNLFSERVLHLSPFQPEYVLKRVFRESDVTRIAALAQKDRAHEVRELMAGVLRDGRLARALFKRDHAFRPVIRDLVHDPAFQTEAIRLLAFLGLPEDLQWIAEQMPTPTKRILDDLWAHDVAATMLEPLIERQWSFLKKCASGDYDPDNVGDMAASAIQTLKLIASPRSQQILEELRPTDEQLALFTSEAITYVKSRPEPLIDRNLVNLGKRVALAVKSDTVWKGNTPPEFNESRDKALIDLNFEFERQEITRTATFQEVSGLWKLRGVHLIRASLPPSPAFEPVLRPVRRDNRK